MEILTHDDRLLWIISMGDNSGKGSSKIICEDKDCKRTNIVPNDIKMFFGSYYFPTDSRKNNKEL